jgi:hypothetical protein
MALLNARSADTGKRNARTQQSADINLSPSRGIAEESTQHTEHRRGAAIPSSEADSEFLTRSTQRKETPSRGGGEKYHAGDARRSGGRWK